MGKKAKVLFQPEQFVPTKFDTAKDKADFANQFVKFVENGFRKEDFPLWFYRRLINTFGHIAHYDLGGFFGEFFTTLGDKIRFIDQTVNYPCYGDPEYVYSDVEKALKTWLQGTNLRATLTTAYRQANESSELGEYLRLKQKYEG